MQLLNSQTLHLVPKVIVRPIPKLTGRFRFRAQIVQQGRLSKDLTKLHKESEPAPSRNYGMLKGLQEDGYHNSALDHGEKCIAEPLQKIMSLWTNQHSRSSILWISFLSFVQFPIMHPIQAAHAEMADPIDPVYDVAAFFELGIQLSYLLMLIALIGVGTFFVIRQVLTRRELDLSAKELQEQVRSGEASATEYFELGAVMLRRKIYPAAAKYFLQSIEKWDGDDQDLSQVYNALGVSYVRDEKLDKAVAQFEEAVKLQPGYVTAWNNLGDVYEKKKEYKAALKAFEEALLFDPNNTVARPRRDALVDRVDMYQGVPVKPSKKK